ncbi:MAG: TIGR03960 family B12-binding radical SAM protein [Johnsonella sp.]|nr:TIGR03960 family B12-binding radical SAM protein [Johnsonella sp.]
MRKLALSDEILLSVDKPARYIGGELNSRNKKPEDVEIRFIMCFPDVYEIGMSHIGMQILYDMFNRREDTFCERVFSPWTDLDKIMRREKIALFSLESQQPVRDADFLGITLQYEMCYTNILQILELSGIARRAKERGEDEPIVIGGGPCSYNPEPLAEFFDIFYIGEGEVRYDELLDLYKQYKREKRGRRAFLRVASRVEGMYVPSLYHVEYKAEGCLKSFSPLYPDVPAKIRRQVLSDMDSAEFISRPVVPFIKVTQDRVVLEIMRGCIRGCRFCQAGFVYRPLREHSVEYLKNYALAMLDISGAEEISLSSLSSSDYRGLRELLEFLIEYTKDKGINISLPSLRIDAFSLDVMKRVQDIKKSSLTFAPEAGTQRLRDVINKGLSEEDILGGAMQAFRGGWNKVKLYFMLGLPTEREEDIRGIPQLCEKIAEHYYSIPKEERQGKVQISASSSFFVPKPFTPFQWAPMLRREEYLERAYMVKDTLKEQLNKKSIKYQYHDAEVTILEGVLARGDRRICAVIEKAYENGSLYDAWSDLFKEKAWMDAFASLGIDPEFYTIRERDLDELLPWDFLDVGVEKSFLKREWEAACNDRVSPNCRQACLGCGAKRFKGGVCFEEKNID